MSKKINNILLKNVCKNTKNCTFTAEIFMMFFLYESENYRTVFVV